MNLGRDVRLNPPIKLVVVYKFEEIFELIPLPVEKNSPMYRTEILRTF